MQALREHAAEGGVAGRGARYARNFGALRDGMARVRPRFERGSAYDARAARGRRELVCPAQLGFGLYLDEGVQGCIVSTFLYPDDPAFDFPRFYAELAEASARTTPATGRHRP